MTEFTWRRRKRRSGRGGEMQRARCGLTNRPVGWRGETEGLEYSTQPLESRERKKEREVGSWRSCGYRMTQRGGMSGIAQVCRGWGGGAA